MANIGTGKKARSNTSPEKGSDKRTNERYRELKKRYLRICRENARLKKTLAVYESWTELSAEDEVEQQKQIKLATDMLPEDTCTSCGTGQFEELDLGHLLIKTCTSCGYRIREKLSLIRPEKEAKI
jgi:hypothetical protein